PHPNSFPTRRSSDLRCEVGSRLVDEETAGKPRSSVVTRCCNEDTLDRTFEVLPQGNDKGPLSVARRRDRREPVLLVVVVCRTIEDRKSTRLNSSHVA